MRDSAENVILVGAYVDAEALGGVTVAAAWRNRSAVERIEAGLADVARRGVRLDYERWLGRKPTRAERRTLSRELARLEDKAYLIRSGCPWRTTHVRLTESGKAMADAILRNPDTEDGPVWAPIQLPADDEEA
ncbi:MAG: hypothetical protein R6V58_10630 [Planctomycetota bacterium]